MVGWSEGRTMINALLINPWVYDFKCHDFWMKPYGLLKIASVLKQSGLNVSLIDCMDRQADGMPEEFKKSDKLGRGMFYSEELDKPEIYKAVPRKYKRYGMPVELFKEKLLKTEKPDIILITSSMTYMYEGVFKAISVIKDIFPSISIILGGTYATLCAAHAEKYSGAAHVWKGSANTEYFNMLEKEIKIDLKPVTGAEFADIAPDYSLYNNINSVSVRLSEGCPFSCSYCAIKETSTGFKQRSKEVIINELETYAKRGIKNIAVYDDALLYKNSFIKDILKSIITEGFDFKFYTPNGLHAAYIDEECAQLMKKTGFMDLRLSLETSDALIQKASGGKVSNRQFSEAVNILKGAGFLSKDIGAYILVGLPGQNTDTIKRDMEFVAANKVLIKPANYSPIPGTVEFEKISADKRDMIKAEPLMQNETYYMAINPEYGYEENEKMKLFAAALNQNF